MLVWDALPLKFKRNLIQAESLPKLYARRKSKQDHKSKN